MRTLLLAAAVVGGLALATPDEARAGFHFSFSQPGFGISVGVPYAPLPPPPYLAPPVVWVRPPVVVGGFHYHYHHHHGHHWHGHRHRGHWHGRRWH